MLDELNFFYKINKIKNKCIEYIRNTIYSFRKDVSQDFTYLITDAVTKAFEEVEQIYNNDVYIDMLKKKNLLLEKNNNNIDNINNNINNIINNNNNNNEIYRRKNFIMNLNDQDKLEIIINKAKGTYGYDNHIIKRKAIADNQYSYWLLLKFKNKTTLSNREVFDSIYNITFNSIDGYESFINTKGEDFNI